MGIRPFAVETDKPLVALLGKRNGYVMLATNQGIEHYAQWPDSILLAAKAWAATLEGMGSPRAYWITLSEEVRHLHIHLFPRWEHDVLKGAALFDTRDAEVQPAWTQEVITALTTWADEFDVKIINPLHQRYASK
jgi:diadenosine tetraphosphate (Ap4A) HIT family hydrolase